MTRQSQVFGTSRRYVQQQSQAGTLRIVYMTSSLTNNTSPASDFTACVSSSHCPILNMVLSAIFAPFMIACCKRVKAPVSLSPYQGGICMSKIPNTQCAISSALGVFYAPIVSALFAEAKYFIQFAVLLKSHANTNATSSDLPFRQPSITSPSIIP